MCAKREKTIICVYQSFCISTYKYICSLYRSASIGLFMIQCSSIMFKFLLITHRSYVWKFMCRNLNSSVLCLLEPATTFSSKFIYLSLIFCQILNIYKLNVGHKANFVLQIVFCVCCTSLSRSITGIQFLLPFKT